MTDIFDSAAFVASNKLVIETVDLVKMYGPHVALEGLNLKLESGAIGILGPNGAGKSTFFKCISDRFQIGDSRFDSESP